MTAPLVPTLPVILNTRPLPMGETLETEFLQHGLSSMPFPTIDNQALKPLDVAHHADQTLEQLQNDLVQQLTNDKAHWIFISKSSVQFFKIFLKALVATAPQNATALEAFSPKGKVIAVGKTTKAELETINADLKVLTPVEANSEALLAMPELASGQNIILVKGLGGRGLITEHFTALNKKVIELSLYQRSPTVFSAPEVTSWLQANIVLATSVDIAQATLDNISQLSDTERQQFLQTKAWVVLSDRIKQFLITQAVEKQNIFVCEHSDNSSIIKMIKHIGKASS